jgi:hypothetical protein
MKTVIESYQSGLRISWQNKRAVFFLYCINLLFAYLMSLPFSAMLEKAMDHTVMADRLLQVFEFTALVSLFENYGRGADLGWAILVFSVLYLLLSTFFSGGIIQLMTRQSRFNVREFVHDSMLFFTRFFRLLLITAGLLVGVLVLYLSISSLADAVLKNAETEFWPYMFFFIKIILFSLLLAWLNMVIDYARIHMVVQDSGTAYRSIRNALGFTRRHFAKVNGLYGLLVVTGIFILLVYLGVEYFVPKYHAVGITLFFFISQLYVLLRIWLRIGFYGGQVHYYKLNS